MTAKRAFAALLASLALLVSPCVALADDAASPVSDANPGGYISKTTDPDTSSSWMNLFGLESANDTAESFSTEEVGRIWLDKSVYKTTEEAQASGAPVSLEDDASFVVGLSAISSAAAIHKQVSEPQDVVFVIPLSSTLAIYAHDGKTYAEHLAAALNGAISRVLEESPEGSRVAVVGYSILTTTMMPLDSYSPNESGNYIEFSRDLPEGGAGFKVTASASDGSAIEDGAFANWSGLQHAVKVAGDVFVDAAKDDVAERKPTLVVMDLEMPSIASTDVAEAPEWHDGAQGFLGPEPYLSETGTGTDAALATMLTMQYQKTRISAAYDHAGGQSLSAYSVALDALGLGGFMMMTEAEQAGASIEDTSGNQTVDMSTNLLDAAAAYGAAADAGSQSVTLDLYGSSTRGITPERVSFPVVQGILEASNGYGFDTFDASFPAQSGSALAGSFDNVCDRILGVTYLSPVNLGDAHLDDPANRLNAVDEIGSFMDVTDVMGIQFQGSLLDGSLAAKAVSTSFADPWDTEAYHEVRYIMNSLTTRYDTADWEGWDTYNLVYAAFSDGQFSYKSADDYSNRISYYVNAENELVPDPSQGTPYFFASQAQIDAVKDGRWKEISDAESKQRIEQARQAGATELCESYFYIGNLENQYSGADVPLYDFVVMVMTNLDSGSQRIVLSIPADALPARKVNVVEMPDGSITMELDSQNSSATPLRLLYEVGPRSDVAELVERLDAGQDVTAEDLSSVFDGKVQTDALGGFLLYTNAFSSTVDGIEAHTVVDVLTAPSNSYYSFVEDTPLYALKDGQSVPEGQAPSGDQLEPLTHAPEAGQTYYYASQYYEASGLSSDEAVQAHPQTAFEPFRIPSSQADQIALRFRPARSGQYYAAAGTPKFEVSAMLENYDKQPNATGSCPVEKSISVESYDQLDRSLLAARLGNNGLLRISPTKETGALSISKTLIAASDETRITDEDRSRPFLFEITLSDQQGNPLSGSVEYTGTEGGPSGIATLDDRGAFSVALTDGQGIEMASIPAGTQCSVSEQEDESGRFEPSYAISQNGQQSQAQQGRTAEGISIMADQKTEVAFSNSKTAGSLSLSKHISGNNAEATRSFGFELIFVDAGGEPAEGSYPYSMAGGEDEGILDVDAEGKATVRTASGNAPLSLSSGQEATIYDLPVGTAYFIEELEAEADGYAVTFSGDADESGKGSIDASGQRRSVAIENERNSYGSLSVSKHAYGFDEADRTFVFTISLKDSSGTPLSGTVSYVVSSDESTEQPGTEQSADLVDGKFSANIGSGETLTIGPLLSGTTYAVEEQEDSGTLVFASGKSGVISADATSVASFTNIRRAGALGLANIIAGNAGDTSMMCDYAITLPDLFSDDDPATTATEEYALYGADGSVKETGTLAFKRGEGNSGNDGTAHIALGNGEGIVIGLGANRSFEIEQNALEGYETAAVCSDGVQQPGDSALRVSGSIPEGSIASVGYVNTRNAFSGLTVEKKIEGNAAEADAGRGRSFSFSISASDVNGTPLDGIFSASYESGPDGRPSTVEFTGGTASFSLSGGETVAFSLPEGSTFSIEEQDLSDEGYGTEAQGQEGTLGLDGSEGSEGARALFTNAKSYIPTSLSIEGAITLVGRSSNAGEFTAALYDADGEPVHDAEGDPIETENRASLGGKPSSFKLSGLQLSSPGIHTFLVKQKTDRILAGVTLDETTYSIAITVDADIQGRLRVTNVAYGKGPDQSPAAGIAFVNTYHESTGSFAPTAEKSLFGGDLSDGQFAFSIQEVDSDGNAIGQATHARNAADGTVDFQAVDFSCPVGETATKTFIIQEMLPGNATAENGFVAGGVTYDARQWRLTVTGSDPDATGRLSFETSLEVRSPGKDGWSEWAPAKDDVPSFENAVEPDEATIPGIVVEKTISNDGWMQDDSFAFSMEPIDAIDSAGKPIADIPLPGDSSVSIDGFDAASQQATEPGNPVRASFGNIAFAESGTYRYLIREQSPADGSAAQMRFSSAIYVLQVKVAQAQNGKLSATSALYRLTDDSGALLEAPQKADTAQFANIRSTDATIPLDGTVAYEDASGTHPLEDGMFRFSVEAKGDNAPAAPLPSIVEAGNAGNAFTFGSIAIPSLEDLAGKTFRYEARQQIPEGAALSEDGKTATLDGYTYDASVHVALLHVASVKDGDGYRTEAFLEFLDPTDAEQGRFVFANSHDSSTQPDPDPDPDPEPEPNPNPDPEPGSDPDHNQNPDGQTPSGEDGENGGLSATNDSTAMIGATVCAIAIAAAVVAAVAAIAIARRRKH